MLIYEYKLDGSKQQYAAIDEAIRIVQFVRNKCLRLWMDEHGISKNDLQCYCAVLAKAYPFVSCLYRKAEKHLKRLHRQVSRKQKKSSNRKKARKQLARAYLKVQRQREDFARKQASTLVSSHDLIAYEQLQIRNMVKNHHLAKSIHDAGWGTFISWVKAYGLMHAVPVIAVAPQFTSQECSACRTLVKKSLSVRTHICTSCGVVLDRDQNAAQNILAKALECTVGHTETSGSPENASGQWAATCEQQCS